MGAGLEEGREGGWRKLEEMGESRWKKNRYESKEKDILAERAIMVVLHVSFYDIAK